ncbi:MAG: globin domain-containing protein [Actinophytocola sp.]|uniref:globin domain-containing protein n=1 Tax=Actinophytocola sp. TaxID=1872138 RepID=UPI003D6BEFD4
MVFSGEEPARRGTAPSYDQWLTWKHAARARDRMYAREEADRPPLRAEDLDWGDQYLLESTVAFIAPQATEVVTAFYNELFSRLPGLRQMFPADLSVQKDRLLAALLALVSGGAQPATLMPVLEQLGRDHRKFGARPAQYRAIGGALMATLSRHVGPHWTPAVEQAWLARYGAAADVMMRAAADADQLPPFWYASVVGHRMCGGDVAILAVRPRQPYPYRAGQYATLESARLPRVWRPYSMATAPHPDQVLEFHIRAVGHGGLSDVLVSSTPGDLVRIGPPQGSVTLASMSQRVSLFIAGGTGWSTVKALLGERARDRRVQSAAHLIVGCRPGEPYDPQFDTFVRRLPDTGTTLVHSADTLLAELAPHRLPTRDLDVFLAGPPGLIEAATTALSAAGVTGRQLHYDSLLLV